MWHYKNNICQYTGLNLIHQQARHVVAIEPGDEVHVMRVQKATVETGREETSELVSDEGQKDLL